MHLVKACSEVCSESEKSKLFCIGSSCQVSNATRHIYLVVLSTYAWLAQSSWANTMQCLVQSSLAEMQPSGVYCPWVQWLVAVNGNLRPRKPRLLVPSSHFRNPLLEMGRKYQETAIFCFFPQLRENLCPSTAHIYFVQWCNNVHYTLNITFEEREKLGSTFGMGG